MATYQNVSGMSTRNAILQRRAETLRAERERRSLGLTGKRSETREEDDEKNTGGFLGGVAYLHEKMALSTLQSIEGIWDYAAGGLAKLFGSDNWAERQMENDWVNYSHADEWYDPDKGWSFAGDVAGGIGSSAPTIGAAVLGGIATAYTGGAAAPVAIKAVAATLPSLVAGLGAAGNATKEAYRETGELGGKEFGYGALVGATEAAVEKVTGGIGVGTGRIVSSIAKQSAHEVTETLVKSGAKNVLKTLGADFASEAIEEGLAEILAPVYQRMTYNPDAENASMQEIGYAALVGGLSGVLMSGANVTVNTSRNLTTGTRLASEGKAASVLEAARRIAAEETKRETGYESFAAVKNTYEQLSASLAETNGQVVTVKQKMLLGELMRENTAAVFSPFIERSAENILRNVDTIVERYAALGMKDENGAPVTFTREQILSGIDPNADRKTYVKQLRKALSTNSVLSTLAVADATGNLTMDTRRFAEMAMNGKNLATRADYNYFREHARDAEKVAVAAALGIENLDAITAEDFYAAVEEFGSDGRANAFAKQSERVRAAAETGKESAKPLPHRLKRDLKNGLYRYVSEDGSVDLAVFKEVNADGSAEYHIYDYESGQISRVLNASEVDRILRDVRTGKESQTSADSVTENASEVAAAEVDTYANDQIKDYKRLSEPAKAEMRALIRQGRALGVSESDILAYAKIAARTGVRVVFDKGRTRISAPTRELVYADGFYDPDTNEIVVNPEGKRSAERLLIHEIAHAVYEVKGGKRLALAAVRGLSADERAEITKRYAEVGVTDADVLEDEYSAHYAEGLLGNAEALERLLEDEPSVKDRILGLLRGARGDTDALRSAAARRLFFKYKRLFDGFAAANVGRNAIETVRRSGEVSDARFSLQFSKEIAENQRDFLHKKRASITEAELEMAVEQTAQMVDYMSKHKHLLPEDKVGKTLVKNGSYDISVENTTICVRTLSYNSFVDMVSEKLKRPLSQMESFLVSQKLYDIAKEPQCLYCYVSLDRKAYNDMILRYLSQRDAVIEAFDAAGQPEVSRVSPLYKQYLDGRKDTEQQWNRYRIWTSTHKAGGHLLSAEEVSTEARRASLARGKWTEAEQIRDILRYAQSASWAKKQTQYVAYYDDILHLSDAVVRNLNKHYGLRWYSFSDYSGAFIVENMQQVTDAAIRGLKGLAYTKDTDYARIFAPSGMNINISVYAKKIDGEYRIDPRQSANLEEAIDLRKKYPNVGIVVVATDRGGVEWALDQEWSDMVIPFHTVRTGADVAEFYNWTVFNSEQGDVVEDQNLWDAYVDSVVSPTASDSARRKVSKLIYPSEHQNDRDTYLRLLRERGLSPRFKAFLDHPGYMKLVNETRQSEGATVPLRAKFDLSAAKASFGKFVEKGGYYEGWYNDGIDVDAEAEAVASDIRAGKRANEVSYGRQDIDVTKSAESRKKNRTHGRRFALAFDEAIDQLENDALDTKINTHLLVLDHTPQLYIDKAGAINREIVMAWDIAYLAMKKEGTEQGNYHGLGAAVMKALPRALEDPLYIVKQKSGRIAAVTKIVVKGKRAVFASIELEAYKSTVQDGEPKDGTYNLVLTVTDAKPNYLQNTIFDGDIVYNKNEEDPAHFILRLKSLKKAAPTHDLAESSNSSVPHPDEKVNRESQNSSGNSSNRRNALPEESSSADDWKALARELGDSVRPSEEELEAERKFARQYDERKRKQDAKLAQKYEAERLKERDRLLGQDVPLSSEVETVVYDAAAGKYDNDPPVSQSTVHRIVNQLPDVGLLPKQTKQEITSKIWRGMNLYAEDPSGWDSVVGKLSRWISNKMLDEARQIRSDYTNAKETVAVLKNGIGKISLPKALSADLEAVLDRDELDAFRSRWERKKGSDQYLTAEDFIGLVASASIGMQDLTEMHTSDALLRIDGLYSEMREILRDKYESPYTGLSDSEVTEIRAEVESRLKDLSERSVFAQKRREINDAIALKNSIRQAAYERKRADQAEKDAEKRVAFETQRAEYEASLKIKEVERNAERRIRWADMDAATKLKEARRDITREANERSRVLGHISVLAQKMKDLRLGTYASATQGRNEMFKNSVEALAKITWHGNLSVDLTRKHFGELAKWYVKDNAILAYQDEQNPGYYDANIAEMLTEISGGTGAFSTDQLIRIRDIMRYFITFDESYNKVYKDGKWIDAEPEAKRYIDALGADADLKVGFLARRGTAYSETFHEPMAVARRVDHYRADGFFTEMLTLLRDGAVGADVTEMEVKTAYDEFLQKNKKYLAQAGTETVSYRGAQVPRLHLIGLYMSYHRRQAQAGLVLNGFSFRRKDGQTVRVPGARPELHQKQDLTPEDILNAAKEETAQIERLLTKRDLEYVRILEKAFNVDARELKSKTDLQRFGYTNATLDYYYPIRRAHTAKSIDSSSFFEEMDRVSNASYNKDTVADARQSLFIESADAVFNRHVHSVCLYANLAPALDYFQRVYNLDVSGNPGAPVSVRTVSQNTWQAGERYLAKLVADIQGIPASSAEGQKVLGWIRSGYAQYQLGANPKTWLSQLSSLFAASSLLDNTSITRGLGLSAKDVDRYCPLAKLRNHDNTVARAQGLIERVNKVSGWFMQPIGKVDRYVVERLFGACQVQIQKDGGAKVGTEENKVAAGKLLHKVILETQQNAFATEKSAAMRSGNEILRTMTMFSSDGMKVIGRVIDAVGEVSVLKSRLKQQALTSEERSTYEASLKAAHRKARKSVGALIASSAYMVMVAQLFRWLYAKEEEDENRALSLLGDFVGNLFGGLPGLRDVVSFFTDGYEIDNYAYSALNDLLSSASGVFGAAADLISGEASMQEIAAGIKRMVYAAGQLFGIPTRNLYNIVYGLTKRISPETAYKIDMTFYEKNFQSDLAEAIEKGDADMVAMLMGLLYGERFSEEVPKAVHNELAVLAAGGHKVTPKVVPSKITVDSVEITLTDEERDTVREIYSETIPALEMLFSSDSYRDMSEEEKAAAIGYVYDTYYAKGIEETLGVDRMTNLQRVADVIGADQLALFYVTTRDLESDVDRNGNAISGSKRKKVVAAVSKLSLSMPQKYLLLSLRGYRIQDGDFRGVTAERARNALLKYILTMKGKTQGEKAAIAEACGFTVRNGKIIRETS